MKRYIFVIIVLIFIKKIQSQELNSKFTGDEYRPLSALKIPANQFTLELLFTPNSTLTNRSEAFSLFEAQTENHFYFRCFFNRNQDGKIEFYIENDHEVYSVQTTQSMWSNQVLHHVTITWNGNSLFLYLDGSNQDSTDPFLNLTGTLEQVKLGGNDEGNFFEGKIQAFRVWSKVLNHRQIMDLKGQNVKPYGQFVQTEPNGVQVQNWLKIEDLISQNQLTWTLSNKIDVDNGSQKERLPSKTEFFSEQKKSSTPKDYSGFEAQNTLPKMSSAPSSFIPKNQDYYRMIDRYEMKLGTLYNNLPTGIQPYPRKAVVALIDSVRRRTTLSLQDKFNIAYLLADSPESSGTHGESKFPSWIGLRKPIMGIYKYKSDFVRIKHKYLDLHLNPVLYFQYGAQDDLENRDISFYINSRGLEFRGLIGNKVSFYSTLTDNQALFSSYVQSFTNQYAVIPGEGFWKKNNNQGAVDFLHARAYINFDILKTTSLQFGFDRHRFGHGYRSLFLSDFASPYSFLKLNTKVWKITYTNLYAQLTADVNRTPQGELLGNQVFPKKYAVFHRLGITLGHHLNIGLFESVVFGRKDNYINDTFDFAYLNPIIFYRSVEQQLGSADNALIGMDFKWNFLSQFQIYGQMILDELVIRELKRGKGWWGNKQALQIGMKYIDVGAIKNLDFQFEFNVIRPYMYSHFGEAQLSNYAHYRQALAHPLGANLREFIGVLEYQPIEPLKLTTKVFYVHKGLNEGKINWGGNILEDNTVRGIPDSDGNPQEYGHRIGQGLKTHILMTGLEAAWMLKHNLFVDAQFLLRRQNTQNTDQANMFYVGIGLRLNAARRRFEF